MIVLKKHASDVTEADEPPKVVVVYSREKTCMIRQKDHRIKERNKERKEGRKGETKKERNKERN